MKSILLLKDKTINMNFCIYNFDENEEKRKILLLQTRQSLSLPDYFLLEQRTTGSATLSPGPSPRRFSACHEDPGDEVNWREREKQLEVFGLLPMIPYALPH